MKQVSSRPDKNKSYNKCFLESIAKQTGMERKKTSFHACFCVRMPKSRLCGAGLSNDQQIARQDDGVAAGDDGIQPTFDENDQRVAGQMEMAQLFSLPAVSPVHSYLLQGELLPVLKAPGGDDQKVAGQQQGVTLGHNSLATPGNHDDQQIVGKQQIFE